MPTTNHLQNETSAYLLQHVHNPVDWHAWNPETLAVARELNKPILLSIGYSACHWCHVMAHESFEDEATAKIMNDDFVNIKVDKEERLALAGEKVQRQHRTVVEFQFVRVTRLDAAGVGGEPLEGDDEDQVDHHAPDDRGDAV